MNSGSALLNSARTIAVAAVAIGLLDQWLFVDTALGINVPIFFVALLAAGWLLRPAGRPLPRARDAWLPIAAISLSAFAALRGDPTLVTLDVLGALALTGASLASFGGLGVVERSFEGLLALGGRVALSATIGGRRVVAAMRQALPLGGGQPYLQRAGPLLRGLLIALPLVILFVALFAAADAVFARIAEDLFNWDLDLGSLPARIALALVVAWLAAGLLVLVVVGGGDAPGEATTPRKPLMRLGSGEATTVLVVLDALFVGFVALQAVYLFGGQDTLAASDLTYAEYARRGFFELLAVAFVVGGLILAGEWLVVRRTRAYLAGAIGLVVLTAVVLASAVLRLRLYQEAYGWTELRFYVLAAIVWLAIGCLIAVVTLATNRSRWLLHGMLGLSILFGVTFNLIGPVRLIAEQNIQRAQHPEFVAPGGETGLDVYYLASLGDDALSVLADSVCSLPSPVGSEAEHAIETWTKWLALDEPGQAWQAWNLSRERARDVRVPTFCLLSRR
ncbi:MAG: DUF4173 domain-containing protein [Chloroflexota bacterium]